MKTLILGDGLLGKYLIDNTNWQYISRKKNKFDFSIIASYKKFLKPYDVIINCIADTDTYSNNKESHWDINYKAVADLTDYCNATNKKLIQISTDYVYAFSKDNASEKDVPVHSRNWYSYTKLLADGYIELKSKNYLIIRCTHKETPFKYDQAYTNVKGNFDYINVIGDLIIKVINKNANGIINIGTDIKNMWELSRRTKDNVKPFENLYNINMPINTTMNVDKLNKLLGND